MVYMCVCVCACIYSLYVILIISPSSTLDLFKTPLIMDVMSTITFGFASCTGVSIMFVDALRAVGVPARLVGTPAWNGMIQNGNHNWVEVYTGPEAGWSFMEVLAHGQRTCPCRNHLLSHTTPTRFSGRACWRGGDTDQPL